MATLYEIATNLEEVINHGMVVDLETGEVLFDTADLDALNAALDSKLEACGLFIKNLEADAKAIREEEKALAKRRQVMERKAEKLRDYVSWCMDEFEIKKLDTPRLALSKRRSESVSITNEELIPEQFFKVTKTVSKTDLRKALKAGEEIAGAEIVENYGLQVK